MVVDKRREVQVDNKRDAVIEPSEEYTDQPEGESN